MLGPCLKSSALCISPCTSSYPGQESWTKDRIRTLSWQQCQWFKQGWTSWTLVDRNQVILSKIFAAFDEMQRLQYSKHLKTARGQQIAPSTESVFNWCNLQRSFLYRHMPIWPITWKSAAQITLPKGIPPAFAWMNLFNPHQNPTPSVDMWITNWQIMPTLCTPTELNSLKTSVCEMMLCLL